MINVIFFAAGFFTCWMVTLWHISNTKTKHMREGFVHGVNYANEYFKKIVTEAISKENTNE